MPKSYWLIDGYNFLHAAGMMPRSVDGMSLDRARSRLIRFLSSRFREEECERITIVFDVHQDRFGLPKETRKSGIKLCFAIDYPDADTMIEELIRQHSAPKQLIVVSSDHRLHKAGRARKAKVLDSDHFYQSVSARRRRSPNAEKSDSAGETKPSPRLSAAEKEQLIAEAEKLALGNEELENWERRIQELDDE